MASRILVTGAALTATGVMVTAMAVDADPGGTAVSAGPTVGVEPPAAAAPAAPATPPPVVIVIRRHGSPVSTERRGSTPAASSPAPAVDRSAPAPSTRSGGS
jgi:hypothetical protein